MSSDKPIALCYQRHMALFTLALGFVLLIPYVNIFQVLIIEIDDGPIVRPAKDCCSTAKTLLFLNNRESNVELNW